MSTGRSIIYLAKMVTAEEVEDYEPQEFSCQCTAWLHDGTEWKNQAGTTGYFYIGDISTDEPACELTERIQAKC